MTLLSDDMTPDSRLTRFVNSIRFWTVVVDDTGRQTPYLARNIQKLSPMRTRTYAPRDMNTEVYYLEKAPGTPLTTG